MNNTIVKINSLGYALGAYTLDADIDVEVSEEIAEKVSWGYEGKVWKYNEENNDFDLIDYLPDEYLRSRRESECFPIINRGQLWYKNLTEEQLIELNTWYQAWLDVTETKVIPEKPDWLN